MNSRNLPRLADATERSLAEGFGPLVLGGDHSAWALVSVWSHFLASDRKSRFVVA